MTGVYAYCVVPAGSRPPRGLEGLDGERVRVVDTGGLSVWVSGAASRPEVEIDAVARHHEVVRSAAAIGTVVPMRFGSWTPDERLLCERVEGRRREFEATLHSLEGAVELGIRVVDATTRGEAQRGDPRDVRSAKPAASGREYMRHLSAARARRIARRTRQDDLADRLFDQVGSLVQDQRLQYLDEPELVAIAHLVRGPDEGEYRSRVVSFAEEEPGALEIHLSGPWPPYSFASST